MEEKRFKARFTPKGDTEANWNRAVGFVPLDKEIIIYKADNTYSVPRIKIGDGVTAVQELPFSGADMEAIKQLINEKGELLIEYVDHAVAAINGQLDSKFNKDGGIIAGDVAVQGNLSVAGTTTTKDTETVMVKDNTIVTNSDGIELIEEAGFAIKTNEMEAYGIMYDPLGDGVKIGLGGFTEDGKFVYNEGEAQFLATRADNITDGNLPQWDNEKKQFVDSGEKIGDFVKFTDYATASKAGVVTTNGVYGCRIISSMYPGELAGIPRTVEQYAGLHNSFFICKSTLDNIKYNYVKGGLVDTTEEWTDEEKAAACETIGAVAKSNGIQVLYATDINKNTIVVSYGRNMNSNWIVQRNGDGTIQTPTSAGDYHAVNNLRMEEYVDENKGTKLYLHTLTQENCANTVYLVSTSKEVIESTTSLKVFIGQNPVFEFSDRKADTIKCAVKPPISGIGYDIIRAYITDDFSVGSEVVIPSGMFTDTVTEL